MSTSITTYLDALAYFYAFPQYNPADTSAWNLERLKELLARLGNPHQKFPSLLIAGTKGKGSTAAISEAILRQTGHKTGLYTSPHLHSFRERIRLNGQPVAEAELVRLARQLRSYFDATPGLTAFELFTAVAFVAFAEAGIETAVLEVGLGGRLDATNAVDPAVAVITAISYDHTQILGDTLTLIAREKAGIIRPGARVISAPQFDEALATLEQVCRERQARLTLVGRDWPWQNGPYDRRGQSFSTQGQAYWLPLLGQHQIVNAVTAIAAVQEFARRTGLRVPAQAIQTGVAEVSWPGRLEILNDQPLVMVDCAMNGDSAEKLIQALERHFPDKRPTFIFGASHDHPIRDMLAVLLPHAARMFVTASSHPRAEKPERLTALAAEAGYAVQPRPNVAAALNDALTGTDPNDLICVAGSLFLVANTREAWLRRQGSPLPPLDPLVIS